MSMTGWQLLGSLTLLLTNCQPLIDQPNVGERSAPTAAPTLTQQETVAMTNIVTAEVILRSANGKSILEATEGVTAATIAQYRVSQDVIDEATKQLTALGFTVKTVGPVSLTIVGEPTTFERVFQTKLLQSVDKSGGTRPAFYQAQDPIQIPSPLSTLVAGVTLPVPPDFFP